MSRQEITGERIPYSNYPQSQVDCPDDTLLEDKCDEEKSQKMLTPRTTRKFGLQPLREPLHSSSHSDRWASAAAQPYTPQEEENCQIRLHNQRQRISNLIQRLNERKLFQAKEIADSVSKALVNNITTQDLQKGSDLDDTITTSKNRLDAVFDKRETERYGFIENSWLSSNAKLISHALPGFYHDTYSSSWNENEVSIIRDLPDCSNMLGDDIASSYHSWSSRGTVPRDDIFCYDIDESNVFDDISKCSPFQRSGSVSPVMNISRTFEKGTNEGYLSEYLTPWVMKTALSAEDIKLRGDDTTLDSSSASQQLRPKDGPSSDDLVNSNSNELKIGDSTFQRSLTDLELSNSSSIISGSRSENKSNDGITPGSSTDFSVSDPLYTGPVPESPRTKSGIEFMARSLDDSLGSGLFPALLPLIELDETLECAAILTTSQPPSAFLMESCHCERLPPEESQHFVKDRFIFQETCSDSSLRQIINDGKMNYEGIDQVHKSSHCIQLPQDPVEKMSFEDPHDKFMSEILEEVKNCEAHNSFTLENMAPDVTLCMSATPVIVSPCHKPKATSIGNSEGSQKTSKSDIVKRRPNREQKRGRSLSLQSIEEEMEFKTDSKFSHNYAREPHACVGIDSLLKSSMCSGLDTSDRLDDKLRNQNENLSRNSMFTGGVAHEDCRTLEDVETALYAQAHEDTEAQTFLHKSYRKFCPIFNCRRGWILSIILIASLLLLIISIALVVQRHLNRKPSSGASPATNLTISQDTDFRHREWVYRGDFFRGDDINDQAGFSVVISKDGSTIAVGARRNTEGNDIRKGSVKVYRFQLGRWILIGDLSGNQERSQFGFSIAISENGNRLAIGSVGDSSNGANSGMVEIYEFTGKVWKRVGKLLGRSTGDVFGASTSISADGRILAVGAPYMKNAEGYTRSGMAYFFKDIGNSTSSWVEFQQQISGKDSNDFLGWSVSLSSDGMRAAIGAPLDGIREAPGYVRIYSLDDNNWTQVGDSIYNGVSGDRFGYSVSLDAHGNTLAIGSVRGTNGNGFQTGNVRVIRFSDSTWEPLGQILLGKSEFSHFGYSVALTENGKYLAVGSPNEESSVSYGMAQVFHLDETDTWVTSIPILANSSQASLGYSVSISSSVMRLFVGGPTVNEAWLYH
jgi:hypothetical protein